ncbi:hypothetical protein, partial [Streptomyces sp. SID3343]|uniref:hypothetical protein n=1 Tax=Streptomyces sp. SID3343 TaxID=2690260 RepID=UPI001F46DDD7
MKREGILADVRQGRDQVADEEFGEVFGARLRSGLALHRSHDREVELHRREPGGQRERLAGRVGPEAGHPLDRADRCAPGLDRLVG